MFENGDPNAINPDLAVDDQADLLPYNKNFEFPVEKLKFNKQLGYLYKKCFILTFFKNFFHNFIPHLDLELLEEWSKLKHMELILWKDQLLWQ